jgi:hypothetical protein
MRARRRGELALGVLVSTQRGRACSTACRARPMAMLTALSGGGAGLTRMHMPYFAQVFALFAPCAQPVPVRRAGAEGDQTLSRSGHGRGRGLAALNCSEEWFEQPISHFSWKPPPGGRATYQQR